MAKYGSSYFFCSCNTRLQSPVLFVEHFIKAYMTNIKNKNRNKKYNMKCQMSTPVLGFIADLQPHKGCTFYFVKWN